MSTESRGHLNAEELVTSVVAEDELSPAARSHIQSCPECGRERVRIQEGLMKLGWSARRFAPEPVRKVTLPAGEPVRAPGRSFGWTLGLGVTAAALAVAVFVLSPNRPGLTPAGTFPAMTAADIQRDAALMTDVSRLAEDALPDAYGDISPEDASAAADDDDDTMDFVVPIDDDGGLT